MELASTRDVGDYFTYEGVKAYKFTYNKFVTADGRVFALRKSTHPKEIWMTPSGRGYRQARYRMSSYGEDICTSVHQLVASAFIDNPNNYEVVDHINEDKTDNRVENLRWTTVKGNNDYYNFKDDRRIATLIARNKKLEDSIRALNNQLTDVRKEKEELVVLQTKLVADTEKLVVSAKAEISKYATMNMPIDKYKDKVDSTGKKFKSIEAMISATGKEVKVDDKTFATIREAARYITEQPDCTASLDTVRKEIRKMVRGDRTPWNYLDKYYIHM